MEIVLKNDKLKVTVESLGAELISMVDLENGQEYVWNKDPNFWPKASPILFPFIGILKNETYRYLDKEYKITTRHGFARDYEFEVVNKDNECVEFCLTSTDETRKIYPFDFKLYLEYKLEGKKLIMNYKVVNLGDNKMYFSLGAHPGFATPIKDCDYSDYYIQFNKKESGEVLTLNGALINSKGKVKAFDGDKIILVKDRFIDDALIVENPNSNEVFIKNNKTGYNLRFRFDGFKYIAFWNKPGAQFVCLEPWNGISDYDNCSGKLEEKIGIEKLEKKEEFERKIEIEIL